MASDEMYAKEVVDAAIEVHRTLGGPGLLEKAYGSIHTTISMDMKEVTSGDAFQVYS